MTFSHLQASVLPVTSFLLLSSVSSPRLRAPVKQSGDWKSEVNDEQVEEGLPCWLPWVVVVSKKRKKKSRPGCIEENAKRQDTPSSLFSAYLISLGLQCGKNTVFNLSHAVLKIGYPSLPRGKSGIIVGILGKSYPSYTHHRGQVGPYQNSSSFYLTCHAGMLWIPSILVYGWGERGVPTPHSCFCHGTGSVPPLPWPTGRKKYVPCFISLLRLIIFSGFTGLIVSFAAL